MRYAIALMLVLAIIAQEPPPAFATSSCLEWTHPGSNINRRSLEETVKALTRQTPHLRETLFAKYRRTVVLIEDDDRGPSLEKAFADHPSFTEKDKERVRRAFRTTGKQFWGIGGLAKVPIPPELVAIRQTLALAVDTSLFTAEHIRRGFRIANFLFGRDRTVACAEFLPAPDQPAAIVLNKLEVQDESFIYTFWHSEECSNAGGGEKRDASRPVAATPPPPLPAERGGLVIAAAPPPPVPPPRKTIRTAALDDTVTLHGYYVKLNEVTKDLWRVEGRQNRDQSEQLLQALADGRVQLYQWTKPGECPTITFGFLEANYDAVRSTAIQVEADGEVVSDPPRLNASTNAVVQPTCKGHVKVTVPRTLYQTQEKRARMAVQGDPRLSIRYPPSRRVTSCSGRGDDAKTCGRSKPWAADTSEFYARVYRNDPARNIEYFFVIE